MKRKIVRAVARGKIAPKGSLIIELHAENWYSSCAIIEHKMRNLSFIGAAERGKLDILERFLASGLSIEATNSRGHNALRGAVENGHLETAQYLLDHGADVNARSAKGWTALHIAARRADLELLRFLLGRGAAIDVVNSDGKTPLFFAVEADSHEAVEVLLGAGSTVRTRDELGRCLVYLAVVSQSTKMLRCILAAGAPIDLHYAPWMHPTVTQPGRYETILHVAVNSGNTDAIRQLLDQGANPMATDSGGQTSLSLAFKTEKSEALAALLEKVGDLHQETWIAMLQISIAKGRRAAFDMLVRHGEFSHLPDAGKALLSLALRGRGQRSMVKALLRSGADINARDDEGRTLLHDASIIGPNRIARLIRLGANINSQDYTNMTPLHCAACESTRVTAAILDAGADIDAQDYDGYTPLHFAASGVADTMRSMSVNISVDLGENEKIKRHISAKPSRRSESERILRLLLERGASVNVLSRDDGTPFDVASTEDIRICLSNYGGCSRNEFDDAGAE